MENRSVAFGLTGFSALLAVIALALRPPAPPTSAPAAPQAAAEPAPIEVQTPRDSVIASYDRGRRLIDEYLGLDRGETTPDRRRFAVRTLVATIPDPFDSHLDWAYDAYLEALRRAFAQAGFVPDRFWLPPRDGALKFPDGEVHRVHDFAPGVFLFRPTATDEETLWLLYLVPEVPTSGIHQGALEAALSERRALSRPSPTYQLDATHAESLLVAGPIFSGSSRSLRLALDRELTRGTRVVRVLTGSATSYANRATLSTSPGCDTAQVARGCIVFGSLVHSDEAMSAAFDAVIGDLGIDEEHVAVLSESATQYGAGGPGYLTIPFPLNIASLRSAFESAPKPLETAPGLPLSEGPRTRLSLDVAANPRESPEVMSRLTVPTLDVVMNNAMLELKRRDVRAVIIKATDVRDKLMLARELKRRMRDVLLFTFENNSLFLRPEYLQDLQGMLVFTTYPLVLDNQTWTTTGGRTSQLLSFPNDAAIGVYNSALALIDGRRPLHEFRSPVAADSAVPVWLSVVGRGAFQPVRVTSSPQWQDYLYTPLASAPAAPDAAHSSTEPTTHQALLLDIDRLDLTSAVVLVLGLIILVVFLEATGQRPSRLPLSLIGLGTPRTNRQRLYLTLFFWSAVVTYFPLVVVTEAHHLLHGGDVGSGHPLSLAIYLAALLSMLVFARGIWLVRTHLAEVWQAGARGGTQPPSGRERLEFLSQRGRAAFWVVFCFSCLYFSTVVVCTGYLASLILRAPGDAVVVLSRISAWNSGVSPIPLLVVCGMSFALWTWWQLQQTKELELPQPLEEAIEGLSLTSPDGRVERLAKEMSTARRVSQWFLPDGTTLGLAAVILLVTALVLAHSLPTIERLAQPGIGSIPFAALLVLGLLGLCTTSTWAVYRLLGTWRSLERFLAILADTPLVYAFSRLPISLSSRTPIGFIGLRRDFEGEVVTEAWNAAASAGRKASRMAVSDAATRLLRAAFTPFRSTLQEPARFLTSPRNRLELVATAIIRGWRGARTRLDQQKNLAREPDNTDPMVVEALRAGEDYVALEVYFYVDKLLLNLRRLAFFLLVTLVLTVIGLSSYPFVPQSTVKGAFVALVVASVIALFYVMTRMSRNEVLSRVTRSTPGKVTWDTSFVLNLVVFGAIPLLVLLSSEFPAIRALLFSWADPVVKAVAKL